MVFIEHFLGLLDVNPDFADFGPRQGHQPFQVGAGDVVVGRSRRHLGEAAQLTQPFFLRLFRHARGFDLLAQFFDFRLLVGFAQLLLDGFHLFAQVILSLALRNLVLNIGLNLGPELQDFNFPHQLPVQPFQPDLQIKTFQQFLLLGAGKRREVGSDEICQPAGIVNVHDDGLEVVREGRRKLYHLLEEWS